VTRPTSNVADDKVRIVCMSDTHSMTDDFRFNIPQGDIFIHAGDFTSSGCLEEVIEFNNWIGNLPHEHKIVIAGNHELSFDNSCKYQSRGHLEAHSSHTDPSFIAQAAQTHSVKDCLTNCIYLEDSEVILYGLKIYGTPWQPEFMQMGF